MTTMTKKQIELTDEQSAVVHQLLTRGKTIQTMGGYAGTGKTTLITHLVRSLPDWAVCAFTGKAAHVLRRKGVPASTIHARIYAPVKDSDPVEFVLRSEEQLGCRGFIVDEASMVSEAIHDDLTSYGLPIVYVGDHGQLPPVGDAFNLMERPDLTLETIHRNAGEIARFAEHLRKGRDSGDWRGEGGKVRLVEADRALSTLRKTVTYDQIVCAWNKTRTFVNRAVREGLGRADDLPVPGDRVICLQNNRRWNVYNGMQGTVREALADPAQECLHVVMDADDGERRFRCAEWGFHSRERPGRTELAVLDYAWAVTCHKAQGDEWDRVLVLEERSDLWEQARWNYTAASRAKKRLDWAVL